MGTAAVIALTSAAGFVAGATCLAKARRVLSALGVLAGPLIAIGMLNTEILPFLFPLLTGPIFLVLAVMGAAGPSRPESWWSKEAQPWWSSFRDRRRLSQKQQWIVASISLAFVLALVAVALAADS